MNKKSGKLRNIIIVSLLIVTIFVTSTGCTALSAYDYGNRNVKFSDMTYTRPDTSTFYAYADTAELLCDNPFRMIPMIRALNGMSSEMTHFASMSVLNEIYASIDYTDEEFAEESVYLAVNYSKIYARYMEVLQKVLNSRSGFICELIMDEETIEFIKSYVAPEGETDELVERETELTDEYLDVYYNQYNDDPAKKAEEIGKIYIELVEIRKELYGAGQYESAMDYYYSVYYRDYTYEEIQDYCEYVKEYIAPIYSQCKAEFKRILYSEIFDENENFTGDAAVESAGEYIAKIDKNFGEVFEYMVEYELCNIKASDKKSGSSFTTYILGYEEPYMMITPSGTIDDYMALIHEFGHYYEMYVNYDNSSCIDVKEIHSQGMELLFTEQYGSAFGEDIAEDLTTYKVCDVLYSILIGCLYEEFQQYAFTTENVTTDMLNEKFADLLLEYGVADEETLAENYEAYSVSWISVPHTFQSPFYYISYSVSAIEALDIYEIAIEESYDDALEKYNEIVSYGSDYGMKELSEVADLVDLFSEDEIKEFAEILSSGVLVK